MKSTWTPKFRSAFAALALLTLGFTSSASALVYTYDNTTSAAIPNSASDGACVTTGLAVNFTVADSFTVATISLGLNVTHATRGELRAVLIAPGGTSVVLFDNVNAEANDNYDIQMSTNGGALNDADADATGQPYYNRRVALAGINFYTGNSAGTWTLRICDRAANGTNGTFNRARLILTSATAATSICTSTASFDWGSNGNAVVFTNSTVSGITTTQGAITDLGGTGAVSAGTLGTPVVTRTTTNGNHPGYYSLSMDGSALAGVQDNEAVGLISVLTFSPAIRDLRFTFLDVDITAGAWEDQVEIIATDSSGARVPYTIAPVAGGDAGLAGDLAEGNSSAAQTATTGNLDVAFSGSVATMTINYSQGADPAADNNFMVIGISDFNYCSFDLGDAPDTYGTTLGAGGARHVVGDRTLYLGTSPPDGETNGAPGAAATLDDTTQVGGVDDEDGVATFPNYAGGGASYTVSVNAVNQSTTTAASLVGYIDWNRDGDFADANERSATVNVPANTAAPTAAFNVTWATPPANAGGTTATYARFRIAFVAAEAESPTGLANSGEVEDYPIGVNVLPVTLSSFATEPSRDGVAVTWTTETETSTVGFKLHGWDGKTWTLLTDKMVPTRALDSLVPQRYELTVEAQGATAFALEDVDLHGVGTVHGPFTSFEAYGREPELQPIDWAGVHSELADLTASRVARQAQRLAAGALPDGFALADLVVESEGIHRVTHEDLLAAGIDLSGQLLDRVTLVLARGGKEVPMWRQAGATPGVFGPGAFLEFRGVPVRNSLYARGRVYQLRVGTATQRVVAKAVAPGSGGPASYTATTAVEKELVYSFAAPNGDPWFEAPVLAQAGPAEQRFAIELDALAAATGRLKVDLWGVTNWPGDSPDHHVELWLNGTRLADDRFDGLVTRNYDLALPAGLALEGENELLVRVVGDTGFAFDLVHVDGYAIVHSRRFEAQNGRLSFPNTGGPAAVDGLPSPEVVVYVRDGRQRLTGFSVEPSDLGYRAQFTVPAVGAGASAAAATVDVAVASTLLRPAIREPRVVPRDLFDGGLRGRADYLIVSHPLFIPELNPLIAAREAQGYGVKVVSVEDLYAAYSGSEVDPEAIRSYLKDAAKPLGVKMVLLVGGDSYDYLDHLGAGSVSLLPTIYAQTDDLIRYSPADSLLADLDGDGLQDLALGRLPARTRGELQLLLDKTLRYPATPAGAVFAADRSSVQRYSGISEDLTAAVPKSWPVIRAYVDELDLAGARAALLAGFSAGPALVNFVGHSGPTVWTFEGLFAAGDSAGLGNTTAPSAVVQWGCWNTYHVSPLYDTLAHRLLLEGPQGAAAVIGSSTLTKESSDARLGPELLHRLLTPGTPIGSAIVAAKRAIAAEGGDLRDVLVGWTLLGDPALVVDR